MDVCRQHLGVTPQTVNRYIQFFELVGTYPHLIICEIPFETIMFCRNDIIDLLKRDNDLALSFAAPLPEIQIGAIYVSTNEGMAAVGKKPKNDEWNAGWEISDEILDGMAQ